MSAIVASVAAVCIVVGQAWHSAHEANGAPIEHVRVIDLQSRNDAGAGFLGMGDCIGRGSGDAATLTLRSSDAPAGKPVTFTAAGCSHQLRVGDTTTARRVGSDRVQISPTTLTPVSVLLLVAFMLLAFGTTAWRRRRFRQTGDSRR